MKCYECIVKFIEVCAWIAIVGTFYINIQNFNKETEVFALQKTALQVSVFNQLTARIHQVYDNPPSAMLAYSGWYADILNSFEEFAFYANRNYLQPDMIKSQEPFIIKKTEEIVPEYPKIIEGHTIKEGEFGELRGFYKRATGKDFQSLIQQAPDSKD